MIHALLLLLTLLGCEGDNLRWVEGTTLRAEPSESEPGNELDLVIFNDPGACRGGGVSESLVSRCIPSVDRARGQVRLGFQFRIDSEPFALPVSEDNVEVYHMDAQVKDGKDLGRVEVIPHDPQRASQLFILVIDGSGSMNEVDDPEDGLTRMDKVRKALLRRDVVDRFFPEEVRTGVVLLTFTQGQPRPVGTSDVEVITEPKRYRELIRDHLRSSGGYTHLYDAVAYATGELLTQKTVKDFVLDREAEPTIIALTDGFNNEQGTDTCSTNVGRLQQTVDAVREARAKAASAKPVLFTVGLGEPYRRGEKPEGLNARINPTTLCGRYADSLIDNPSGTGLEDLGIDHVSLAWLAEAGGGVSFVKRDAKGLAQVFLEAAAKRYEWFEVKYRVADSIYHRKSFEAEIRMQQPYVASTMVELFPSPWLDAPTARTVRGEEWVVRSSLMRTLTILMPVLGLLVFLNYLPAALFNARRAVLRRARPRK